MCGILLFRRGNNNNNNNTDIESQKEEENSRCFCELKSIVDRRGPSISRRLEKKNYLFYSSVLSIREPLVSQPVEVVTHEEHEAVLQFNGEIYACDIKGCDTDYVRDYIDTKGPSSAICELEGEFAFVWTDCSSDSIYFARDCIGQRSLLYKYDETNGDLWISSVAPFNDESRHGWIECIAGTLYKFEPGLGLSWTDLRPKWTVSRDLEYNGFNETQLLGKLDNVLTQSVSKRLLSCSQAEKDKGISILFSGGIDCSVLAALADDILDSNRHIDLLNVAFENPRTGSKDYDTTPDRVLGLKAFKDLQKRSKSSKRIRFVRINVPYSDTIKFKSRVQSLMWPKDSVMDLSIALAFFFASRGIGILLNNQDKTLSPYECPSDILISGLGADELLAGYTRHDTSFRRNGSQGLCKELEMDFARLYDRNLGRDDRVLCDWGKEARYPFLDDEVIKFCLELPLNAKFHFSHEDEVQDDKTKYLLRLLGKHLHLETSCRAKKRAIQFGARSAKMEKGQGKIKGTDKII